MKRHSHSEEGAHPPANGAAAVAAHIPHGLFIMTSSFEGSTAGTLVRWVQRCSEDPIVVMISLRRGQAIEPLIRDSRAFALCQISEDDRFLQRKFCRNRITKTLSDDEDGLIALGARAAPSGSPILDHAMSYMDCELLRNVDLDSDYRLYVGQVHHAVMMNPAKPAICYGVNGHAK